MKLTEWFGNGYAAKVAPKAFDVAPGVALDERGARLHKANTGQDAHILRGTEPASPLAVGVHWFHCAGAPLDYTHDPAEARGVLRRFTREALERVKPEYVVIDGWQPEDPKEPRIPALLRKLGYRFALAKLSIINPQRGDRRDWHFCIGKRVNKTATFKLFGDAVFSTRQWGDIAFERGAGSWALTDQQTTIVEAAGTREDYHIIYNANRASARLAYAMNDFCPVKIEQTHELHIVVYDTRIRPITNDERAKLLGLENVTAEYDSLCHAADSRMVGMILRSIWNDTK